MTDELIIRRLRKVLDLACTADDFANARAAAGPLDQWFAIRSGVLLAHLDVIQREIQACLAEIELRTADSAVSP